MPLHPPKYPSCRRSSDIPLPAFLHGEAVAVRIRPDVFGEVSMRKYNDGESEWFYQLAGCNSKWVRESDLLSIDFGEESENEVMPTDVVVGWCIIVGCGVEDW